ncbi:MAG: NAD-dependent epimerase/dehydratase family protein [Ferruginibacter sp.]
MERPLLPIANMHSILIIGSSGFIGGQLVRYFSDCGWTVHGCDLRTGDQVYHFHLLRNLDQDLAALFQQYRFDYCVNAGGNGLVSKSVEDPVFDFNANVRDTAILLNAIRQYSLNTKLLHLSSAAVYGNPKQLPIRETDTPHPVSPYGWHKRLSELLCQEFAVLHHVQVVIARPFSVYGPTLHKQLFWDAYRQYADGKPDIELWGTGHETRDFIHIQDFARAAQRLLERGDMKAGIYNLSSGIETSIADAMTAFTKALQPSPTCRFSGQTRAGDPLHWRADLTKITALGFSPSISFQEGIAEVAVRYQQIGNTRT